MKLATEYQQVDVSVGQLQSSAVTCIGKLHHGWEDAWWKLLSTLVGYGWTTGEVEFNSCTDDNSYSRGSSYVGPL